MMGNKRIGLVILLSLCTVLGWAHAAGMAPIRLVPGGDVDMTATFLAAVDKVRTAGKGTILLKKGDYRFASPETSDVWVSNHDNPRPRRIFLPLRGVTNLTIRAEAGTRFVADGEGVCLALIDTKNVKIENVAFDFVRPFFSIWTLKGGKLVASPEYPYELQGRTIFATGRGWREKQIICELFDKDTKAFRGSTWWDGSIDRVFGGHPDGTLAMTRSPYRPSPCVLLYRAENAVFRNCGAYAAAGMGFLAQRSGDIMLDGWKTRGLRPLALQADATHFSNCRGKVIVKNGLFEGMVDDAINVHSTSLRIVGKPAADTIVCQYMHGQSVGFEVFLPGERIRFIKGRTFEPGVETTVVAAKMLAHNKVELKLAGTVPPRIRPRRCGGERRLAAEGRLPQ